jgi:2-isopropylmalate synthase
MRDRMRSEFFRILRYNVSAGEDFQGECSSECSEAAVKLEIYEPSADKKIFHETSDGIGPVDALDKAFRKALSKTFPEVAEVRLTDYSVHIHNGDQGTESSVEVTVTSSDGVNTWVTKGVSGNIIKASFIALAKGLEKEIFKLKYKNV